MAKKGYPGLVLVPPSDRQIFRRRLARWTFLIIAVLCGLSAINIWIPSSDNNTDCQTDISHGVSPDFQEECGHPGHTATEAPSRQSELTVTEGSQGIILAKSDRSVPTTAPDTDRLAAQHKTYQSLRANPKDPPKASSDRAVAALVIDKSNAVSRAASSASDPHPDTILAERGDAFAQYRLGRFYAHHAGPHTPESVSWYRKASNGLRLLAWAGNGEAMYVLGVMYAFGRGVTKDTEQARLWLTEAVERQVEAARPVLASVERHRNFQGERTGQGG